MLPRVWQVLFVMFFLSGFCGLLYQMVWLRLAFASFGIITPVLSVVVSVFMLGLALGSYAGGKLILGLMKRTGLSALCFYALIELITAMSAICVPRLYKFGALQLLQAGQTDSASYMWLSAAAITVAILPWCLLMGATFPVMMAYVKDLDAESKHGFSHLYLANVLGAMAGTVTTSFILVEELGFRHTLYVGLALNVLAAVIALCLARKSNFRVVDVQLEPAAEAEPAAEVAPPAKSQSAVSIKIILFATGFASMAMEVIWTRGFIPVLGNEVYSFAALLFTYLCATCFGSYAYRSSLKLDATRTVQKSIALLAVASFLPVLMNDPRVHAFFTACIFSALSAVSGQKFALTDIMGATSATIALISIAPFCHVLGYLTPQLIDTYSGGSPSAAGEAYAINTVGCIFGPLLAAYWLLPFVGVRYGLVLLGAPFLIWSAFALVKNSGKIGVMPVATAAALMLLCLYPAASYEDIMSILDNTSVIRRDQIATVISSGKGFQRRLIVNGRGVTALVQNTKLMAHLPVLLYDGQPKTALVICFGMGTTFRSLLRCGLDTTAVELVPSVRDAFNYYFDDAPEVMSDPHGKVIVDDGRRFLKRSNQKFDIITLDPPPPHEAAGLSLLLSKEFYQVAKDHLSEHGILQNFLGWGDTTFVHGEIAALSSIFPYVKVYDYGDDNAYFCLASMHPILAPTQAELEKRLTKNIKEDLMEFRTQKNVAGSASDVIETTLAREIPVSALIDKGDPAIITDDGPLNEYFLLRRLKGQIAGDHKEITGSSLEDHWRNRQFKTKLNL